MCRVKESVKRNNEDGDLEMISTSNLLQDVVSVAALTSTTASRKSLSSRFSSSGSGPRMSSSMTVWYALDGFSS